MSTKVKINELIQSELYVKNLKRIILLSMIFSSLTLLVGRGNLSSHTHQFLDFAKSIASGQPTSSSGVRPCGYPLLIFISGYTKHGSMIVIYIIQALCGFGFPILFYSFIGKKMPSIAFFSSLLLILSMYPYQLVKLLTYDQIANFLLLTCAWSLLNTLGCTKLKNLLSLGGITAFLANFKAANILVPIIPISIFSVFVQDCRKSKSIKILILTAISVSLTCGLYLFTKQYRLKGSSYTGCQLFYGPYINSKKFGVDLTLNQGKAMKELSRKLEKTLKESGKAKIDKFIKDANINTEVAKDHFERFKGENLSKILIQNPKYLYFEFICHLLEFDNDTFLCAAKEMYFTHPELVLKYFLFNLKIYFTDPGWRNFPNSTRDNGYRKLPYLHELVIGGGGANYRPDIISELEVKEVNICPWESLKISKYVSPQPLRKCINYLSKKLIDNCPVPLLVLNVVGIFAVIFKRERYNLILLTITTSFVIYNAFVTCLIVEPEWFYKMSALPLELAGATVGFYCISSSILNFRIEKEPKIISMEDENVFACALKSQKIEATQACFLGGLVVSTFAALQTILVFW